MFLSRIKRVRLFLQNIFSLSNGGSQVHLDRARGGLVVGFRFLKGRQLLQMSLQRKRTPADYVAECREGRLVSRLPA